MLSEQKEKSGSYFHYQCHAGLVSLAAIMQIICDQVGSPVAKKFYSLLVGHNNIDILGYYLKMHKYSFLFAKPW